jgi:C4-dicarboxylate-specific signal transduction histidine kinase
LSTLKSNWLESEGMLNQLMEIARTSALAEMASGIAHELNQPLGAIATFSQAGDRLLNRPEPLVHRALEVFRQINTEAMSAGEGIRRIRRLFDHQELKSAPCRIGELIEELRPVLDLLARRDHAQLQFDIAPALPELQLDRLKIQHVVFALVQNAFDASAQGGAAPCVKIAAQADRYAVEVGITDGGPGIPDDIRDQLFRPFFTTKPKGTGLGLASARAIIEAHQGSLGFERIDSGGSRFWFRLPLTE